MARPGPGGTPARAQRGDGGPCASRARACSPKNASPQTSSARSVWLIDPLVLGPGKRFFGDGTIPAAFKLTHSATSPNGVLLTRYERASEVRMGSFAIETTAAELERRAGLR